MNFLAKLVAPITRVFHPRGTQRILKILFPPQKLKIKGLMEYDGDLRINFDTNFYAEREMFFRGYYEKNVIDVIKKVFKEGFVAIDAGAYIGSHTLVMAKLAGKSGKVFAFEPHPDICERLAENVRLSSLLNVKIISAALSDKPGRMTLFSYNEKMPDKGTSSLYELKNLEKAFEVDVSTIDAFAEKEKINCLDFIKIDTRGSDFPVILGARESIRKFQPLIVFEYNRENWSYSGSRWEEAKMFFDENGYNLFFVNKKNILLVGANPTFTTSHNILAVPKSRKDEIKL